MGNCDDQPTGEPSVSLRDFMKVLNISNNVEDKIDFFGKLLQEHNLDHPEAKKSVVEEYLTLSPHCADLMDLWGNTEWCQNREFVTAHIQLIRCVLSIEDVELFSKQHKEKLIRSIIKNKLQFVARQLAWSDKPLIQYETLSVMSLMTQFELEQDCESSIAGSISREFVKMFDFQCKAFVQLASRHFKEVEITSSFLKANNSLQDVEEGMSEEEKKSSINVREAYVLFCLGLLRVNDSSVNAFAVKRGGLLTTIFGTISDDSLELLTVIFNHLNEFILSNERFNIKMKRDFFCFPVICHIRKLLSSPEDDKALKALNFLRSVFIKSSGIYKANSNRTFLSMKNKNFNSDFDDVTEYDHSELGPSCSFRIVQKLVIGFQQNYNLFEESFLCDIISLYPELVVDFFKSFQPNLDPRPSFKWFTTSSFLIKLLSLPLKALIDCDELINKFFSHDNFDIDVLFGIVLPIARYKKDLMRSIQNGSPFVVYSALNILVAILNRYHDFKYALLPFVGAENMRLFEKKIRSFLPTPEIVFSLCSRFPTSNKKKQNRLIYSRVLCILRQYIICMPQVMSEAKFDLSKLIPVSENKLEGIHCQSSLGLLVQLLLCLDDKRLSWIAMGGCSDLKLNTLFQLLLSCSGDIFLTTLTKKLFWKIFKSVRVFGDESSITPYIEHLNELSSFRFVSMLIRFVHSNYFLFVEKALHHANNPSSLRVSPMTAAMVSYGFGNIMDRELSLSEPEKIGLKSYIGNVLAELLKESPCPSQLVSCILNEGELYRSRSKRLKVSDSNKSISISSVEKKESDVHSAVVQVIELCRQEYTLPPSPNVDIVDLKKAIASEILIGGSRKNYIVSVMLRMPMKTIHSELDSIIQWMYESNESFQPLFTYFHLNWKHFCLHNLSASITQVMDKSIELEILPTRNCIKKFKASLRNDKISAGIFKFICDISVPSVLDSILFLFSKHQFLTTSELEERNRCFHQLFAFVELKLEHYHGHQKEKAFKHLLYGIYSISKTTLVSKYGQDSQWNDIFGCYYNLMHKLYINNACCNKSAVMISDLCKHELVNSYLLSPQLHFEDIPQIVIFLISSLKWQSGDFLVDNHIQNILNENVLPFVLVLVNVLPYDFYFTTLIATAKNICSVVKSTDQPPFNDMLVFRHMIKFIKRHSSVIKNLVPGIEMIDFFHNVSSICCTSAFVEEKQFLLYMWKNIDKSNIDFTDEPLFMFCWRRISSLNNCNNIYSLLLEEMIVNSAKARDHFQECFLDTYSKTFENGNGTIKCILAALHLSCFYFKSSFACSTTSQKFIRFYEDIIIPKVFEGVLNNGLKNRVLVDVVMSFRSFVGINVKSVEQTANRFFETHQRIESQVSLSQLKFCLVYIQELNKRNVISPVSTLQRVLTFLQNIVSSIASFGDASIYSQFVGLVNQFVHHVSLFSNRCSDKFDKKLWIYNDRLNDFMEIALKTLFSNRDICQIVRNMLILLLNGNNESTDASLKELSTFLCKNVLLHDNGEKIFQFLNSDQGLSYNLLVFEILYIVISFAAWDLEAMEKSSFDFAKHLLSYYNMSLSYRDRLIREILFKFDNKYPKLLLKFGYRCGRSVDFVDDTLQKKAIQENNEFQWLYNDFLDAHRIKASIDDFPMFKGNDDILANMSFEVHVDDNSNKQQNLIYDPFFMLPLIANMIASTSSPSHEFVDRNLLGYCICALSNSNLSLRKYGYGIVAHIHELLSSENCLLKESHQMLILFESLRNSITAPYQQLPHLFCIFLNDSIPILLRPSHILYSSLNHFLLARPFIDLSDVPMFYSVFNSSNHLTHKKERAWLLHVMHRGIKGEFDVSMMERRHVFQILFAFFNSDIIADQLTRDLILKIVIQTNKVPVIGNSLLHRLSLLNWLNCLILNDRLPMHTICLILQLCADCIDLEEFNTDHDEHHIGLQLEIMISSTVSMLKTRKEKSAHLVPAALSFCEKVCDYYTNLHGVVEDKQRSRLFLRLSVIESWIDLFRIEEFTCFRATFFSVFFAPKYLENSLFYLVNPIDFHTSTFDRWLLVLDWAASTALLHVKDCRLSMRVDFLRSLLRSINFLVQKSKTFEDLLHKRAIETESLKCIIESINLNSM